MGAYLQIQAKDAVLEHVAGACPGSAVNLRAFDASLRATIASRPFNTDLIDQAYDHYFTAVQAASACDVGTRSLESLIFGQGLHSVQAVIQILSFGRDQYCDETSSPSEMLTILRFQRGWDRVDAAFQSLIDRALTAVNDRRITRVYWS